MNDKFKAWLKQPTTVHGIGALLAVAAGAVAYYVAHSPEVAMTAAGSVFGVVCMAMGDNTGDKSSVEKLASDAIQAIVTKRVATMLPALGADMAAVLATPAPVVVVPVTPGPPPVTPAQ